MDDIHKAHDKHGDALVDPLYNSNQEKIPKQTSDSCWEWDNQEQKYLEQRENNYEE